MKWGLFLVMVCLPLLIFGQIRSVTGTVFDRETGERLSNASIVITGDTLGTQSDEQGGFILAIPRGQIKLSFVVSHVGYHSGTIDINERSDYNVALEPVGATLNEVVVTGASHAIALRENPISIALVSSKAIATTVESNVIDVLVKNVPGLNAVKTGPNISKPFIRGLGYNRVLTLYDGIRQEGQQWGDEHGIEVDAYNIGKAEVIKGPASLMFGSDALAGVVSLFPFQYAERDGLVKGRVVSEYQSNNGLIGNGVRIAQNTEHWNWMLSSSYRLAKNYTNRVDGRVYNTGFDEKNLTTSIGHVSARGHSAITFTLYDNLQGIPDGSRDSISRQFTKQIYEGAFDDVKNRPIVSSSDLNSYQLSPLHQHIQHYRLYTNNLYRVGQGDMDLLLAAQRNVRREYNHPTKPDQAGMNLQLTTINYGIRYNAPERSNTEISIGMNGMYQQDVTKNATDFPIPDYSLNDIGGYLFTKWHKKKWIVSGGVRYDARRIDSNDFYVRINSQTMFAEHTHIPDTANATLQFPTLNQRFAGLSWSLGTTYAIGEHANLKANLARGYRAPNMAEIASNGLDPGAHIVYIGNRNFEPEFSFQQDIGLNVTFSDLSASLSLFNNNVQHYIYLSQLVDDNGNPIELVHGNKTFQYLQGSAQLYGMETTLEFHPQRQKGFSIVSNVSMVFGNNTQDEFHDAGIYGQYLPFIPPVKVLTTAQREFKTRTRIVPLISAKIDIDYSARQERYLALYNTETATPAYVLTNIGLSIDVAYSTLHTLKLQLQANNLFDVTYQSNMSRLKYFEYYSHSPNNRYGMYSMGRNLCIRIEIPF